MNNHDTGSDPSPSEPSRKAGAPIPWRARLAFSSTASTAPVHKSKSHSILKIEWLFDLTEHGILPRPAARRGTRVIASAPPLYA